MAEHATAVALAFLRAYWRGDLDAALACCVEGATIELPASVPLPTPAPISAVLPLIFAAIYPKFVGGRFEVDVERTVSDGAVVAVEYLAHGPLVSGRQFRVRYAAFLDVEGGKVTRFRAHTDTKQVAEDLLS